MLSDQRFLVRFAAIAMKTGAFSAWPDTAKKKPKGAPAFVDKGLNISNY